ncbi:MAG: alpha-amylase family glycosyl hydrolase [Myxococcota bacterium]
MKHLSVLSIAFALVACGDDDGGAADAAPGVDSHIGPIDAAAPPSFDGLCDATITYETTASTPRVFVGGEWNEFAPDADELIDDGTGRYAITLRLRPGIHAYKLVVEDGADPWRFDPANDYRVFLDGVENSALRVPDCSRPIVVPGETTNAAGAFTANARVTSLHENAGTLTIEGLLRSGRDERMLSADELQITTDGAQAQVSVALSGLATGKHTLVVRARDRLGNESEHALFPFWVEETPFDWNDAIIYMAMTDRFRNGDPSNDINLEAATGAGFVGGDLQGLAAAIEEGYFDDLGVNALWLTPFNQNPEGAYIDSQGRFEVGGYHGYWPTDPLAVDERIGGGDALHGLIEAAHARGIRVLMDLVANHVHEDHPYYTQHPTWFNDGCVCGTGDCDWTARRLDCLFRPYMPDVNWRNTEASERFIDDALRWLEDYDLDGFRIDAVKHVEDLAILNLGVRVRERFQTAGTHYFLMGETAMGWDPSNGPYDGGNRENYDTISRYIGPNALDGQFDFVLYYAASLQFLNDEPGRGMAHVDFWSQASMERYPPEAIMTPYIGSHDVPRFITQSSHPGQAGNQWENLPPPPSSREPYDRMYTAFGWMLSLPGAPLLYYGDEYGEHGAADPDNRHPMRFGDELNDVEREQRARVSTLLQARRNLPGLRSRDWNTVLANESTLVVERGRGDDAVLVIVHASGQGADVSFDVPASLRGPVVDVLSDETFDLNGGRVAMPARSVRYLRAVD